MDGAAVVVEGIGGGEVSPVEGELRLPLFDCGVPGFISGELDIGSIEHSILILDEERTDLRRGLNGEVCDACAGIDGKVWVASERASHHVDVGFHAAKVSAYDAKMRMLREKVIASGEDRLLRRSIGDLLHIPFGMRGVVRGIKCLWIGGAPCDIGFSLMGD